MYIKSKDKEHKIITVSIPITNGTGKSRIKKRSITNEYGFPVVTRDKNLLQWIAMKGCRYQRNG